jgi:2'-5' RNA ligase
MRVKKYIQFVKESTGYKLGCVMVEVPVSNWNEITSIIDKNDLYEVEGENYGIQDNPHLTLLYPVKNGVEYNEVKNILDKVICDKINININGIDIFTNDKFDVVKFNVECDDYLSKIHKELKSNIPNEDKYDVYTPHITIGYVKSGQGNKYINKDYKFNLDVNTILYTNLDKEDVYEI